jgi:AcrR family transcriptional regulator
MGARAVSGADAPARSEPPGKSGALDPRVQRTRNLLQEALLSLLAERHFDEITVQEIAARATVNRATFYAHFLDKHDLFAQLTREWFQGVLDERLPGGASFSHANLHCLVQTTMDALASMQDHCRPTEALEPLIMSAVQEELLVLVRGWLTTPGQGGICDDAARETAAAGVSWAIFGAALTWSQTNPRPPAPGTADEISLLLMEGLATVIAPDLNCGRERPFVS